MKTAMKICMLTSGHSPLDDRIFYREVMSLRKIYDDITIIAQNDKDYDEINGVKVLGIPRRKDSGIRERIRTLKRLYKKGLEVKADVYHCHEPDSAYIGYRLKKALKSRLIYDSHEYHPEAFSENFGRFAGMVAKSLVCRFEKFICRHCDCVITVNNLLGAKFRRLAGHVAVLPNYPVKAMLDLEQKEREQGSFVYVGSVSEAKGCRKIVEAMNLCKNDVRVTFIGEVEKGFRESLGETAEGKCVEFLGMVEHKSIFDILARHCGGLVLLQPAKPRYTKCHPVKLFDYMACGLAVIGSNFSMIREIVEKEACGILVDPTDTKQISMAMDYLLSSPDEMARMGERGRKAILDRYNWENMEAKLGGIYRRLENSQIRNRNASWH